jgi:hypothetical protein
LETSSSCRAYHFVQTGDPTDCTELKANTVTMGIGSEI